MDSSISFNNNDEVLSGINETSLVNVPKTVEHLEKIQNERYIREQEEENDDDDDDDYESIPRIKIGNTDVSLDDLDVHNVTDKVKIEPDVILDDIEILS